MGADIGMPLLAMHSIRETTGVRDNAGMVSLLGAFYAAEEPLP
jgi:aspartyl aminopeptidase